MAIGLKLRIYEVEGLNYLCSENIGADQLREDRADDLYLCFRICINMLSHDAAQIVFSGSIMKLSFTYKSRAS